MSWGHWICGLPAVALLALCPIAHASAVDPTWTAGFRDESDHDKVATLVTSMVSAADMSLVVPPVPVLVAATVVTLEPESIRSRTFSPTASRAPPVLA